MAWLGRVAARSDIAWGDSPRPKVAVGPPVLSLLSDTYPATLTIPNSEC
jgi:hypothetical protein